jgi:hypothetical protein
MTEITQELKDRLCSEPYEDGPVWTFLFLQHEDMMDIYEKETGQAIDFPNKTLRPTPTDFFRGKEDIEQFALARAWWARFKDLPPQFACPNLLMLAREYNDQHPTIGATFMERLTIHANRLVAWCNENGIDPSYPDETKEARKVRLKTQKSAEALAVAQEKARLKIEVAQEKAKAEAEVLRMKAELRTKAKAEPKTKREQNEVSAEHTAAVKEAYKVYVKRCEDRKRIESEQSILVKTAYDAWEKLRGMTPEQYIEEVFNDNMEKQRA